MRILLLGGSGRLGTAMRTAWADRHVVIAPEQTEVDWMQAGLETLIAEVKPEFVINTAAYNNVDGAEGEGRTTAFHVNAELPRLIAEAAKQHDVPFLHFSTDYVFAGDKQEGYVESDVPAPISEYGKSKLAGEENVLREYPLGAYVVRTSRLYGDRGSDPEAKKSFIEIIVGELKTKPSFEVNDFEVSAPTSVPELVDHIEKYILIDRPQPGIYHMTNQGGVTWLEWAVEIRDQLGYTNQITPRDPKLAVRPAQRPAFSMLKSTKLPSMLPWQEALQNYIQNFKS